MATFTGPERARCVFWFEESKSATTVQRKFRKSMLEILLVGQLFMSGISVFLKLDVR